LDKTQRSYRKFSEACKSPQSLETYNKSLSQFLRFSKINSYDKLARLPIKKLNIHLEDYVFHLKDRHKAGEIRANYFRPQLASLDLFLSQNEKDINFKRFRKMIPEDNGKVTGAKPYSTKDIQDMISVADIRGKALVLFFASVGCRGGAYYDLGNYLKFKHIKLFSDGCIGVLIYPDTKYEHPGFLTPESAKALMDYKQHRIVNGEYVSGDSPLFRD